MSSLFEHCHGEKRTISSFTRQLVNSLTSPLVNFSTRQLVNLSSCQLVLSLTCPLFSKIFNIMSALFATNRSPCRKKSILAKVCFDANKG